MSYLIFDRFGMQYTGDECDQWPSDDHTSDEEIPEFEKPEGVVSLLDTDMYKLTMQCAILQFLPDVEVTYAFTNRTPHMKLTREAYQWLEKQITKLGDLSLTNREFKYLKKTCTYFSETYLNFLKSFHLQPSKHVRTTWTAINDTGRADDVGELDLHVGGLWVDTILYEIPLLALISEAYFKFVDKDWNYDKQHALAFFKGRELIEAGCMFSEFGTRRRRDYRTQEMVIQGLKEASHHHRYPYRNNTGKVSTSNVHFAMTHALPPVGTVAHEWFMGIASITEYETANEAAMRYWVSCYGEGVLGITLTDTFGTPAFLEAFKQKMPNVERAKTDAAETRIPAATSMPGLDSRTIASDGKERLTERTYAQIFEGVRQDSGNPLEFVKTMRDFYDSQGIKDKKTIVFSDSLNVKLCLEYKKVAEEAGFQPTFGIGTFFTNDFVLQSDTSRFRRDRKKSPPLNIVIKLSSAGGKPAIKISDNMGKNTGDKLIVNQVKKRLGYQEKEWEGGDETTRWGSGKRAATDAAVEARNK